MMVSGARVRSAALRSGLGLGGDEHLAGFVAIGTGEGPAKDPPRRKAAAVLGHWPAR
jgi:hypothetical protein